MPLYRSLSCSAYGETMVRFVLVIHETGWVWPPNDGDMSESDPEWKIELAGQRGWF
jgi:hypothetical protein